MSSAGITEGMTLSQPLKVYPTFVGSLGLTTVLLNSSVIAETSEPPSLSKVMVYVLISYCAVRTILSLMTVGTL